MSLAGAEFVAAFDRLPRGTFRARYGGRRRVAVRSALAGGRAGKLVAEAAGGRGYVSMNLYRLAAGARRSPCEMAGEEARAFVLGLVVEGAEGAGAAGERPAGEEPAGEGPAGEGAAKEGAAGD